MAELVSTKSKDPSTKVGAVIVGPGNEILSTGFNGFPRGVDEIEDHLQDTGFIKLSIKFPVEEMPERKLDIKNFILEGLKVIQTN